MMIDKPGESLEKRIYAAREIAARRLDYSCAAAAELIRSSKVGWSEDESGRQPSFVSKVCGCNTVLGYMDHCFGDPDIEEMAGRYIYWAKHAVKYGRSSPYTNVVVVRPIAPFRRSEEAEAFSRRVEAGRSLLLEGVVPMDKHTRRIFGWTEVHSDEDTALAGTYVMGDSIRASYHYRCEPTPLKAPLESDIASELLGWMRMATITAGADLFLGRC